MFCVSEAQAAVIRTAFEQHGELSAVVVELRRLFPGGLLWHLRRATIMGGVDSTDGFTVTLWRDDRAMNQAASFTRARIVTSSGSWDGDPVAGLA